MAELHCAHSSTSWLPRFLMPSWAFAWCCSYNPVPKSCNRTHIIHQLTAEKRQIYWIVCLIWAGMSSFVPTTGPNLSYILFCRNIFSDNLFQASFQQTHTVYVPKKSPTNVQLFGTGNNETTAPSPNTDELTVNTNAPSVETALIRDLQYRNGTNTLGIVFFCLVFGTMLGTIGNKGQVVIDFFTAVFEVVMKMVTCVMWLTPIGISSVIAGKILSITNLAPVMMQLMWFIITVAIGVFFYQWIVMQLIYLIIVRKNPFKFYYGLIHPMLMAFATASTWV